MGFQAHIIKIQSRIILGLIVVILVILGICAGIFFEPKGRVNCDSFISYSDIVEAYNNGAKYLDRGGRAGVPCESRAPKGTVL